MAAVRAAPAARQTVAARVPRWRRVPRWLHGVPADWALALLVGVGTLALTLPGLASVSLSFDEALSVQLARQPANVLWQYVWGSEDHMTLYYALLWVWLHLTGLLGMAATELVVRLPSALCSAAAASVLFLLARRLFGRGAALLAVGLYALDALVLYEAQKARSYSLQLLLLMVAWYALVAILHGTPRQRRSWAAYVAAMALAVYAQPFSALVLAAQVAAFGGAALLPGAWRARARHALVRFALSVGAIGVLIAPEAANALLHGQPNAWVPPARPGDLLGILVAIAGDNAVLVGLMALVLALPLLAAARRRLAPVAVPPAAPVAPTAAAEMPHRRATHAPGLFAVACWLVVPIALSYAATQPALNLHLFWWRYLCVAVPPVCLLVAASAGRLPQRALRYGAALLLLAVSAPTALGYYATAQLADFKTAANWLATSYHVGDGVIYLPGKVCSVPMQYYGQVNHWPFSALADAPGAWQWAAESEVPFDLNALAEYAARHPRVFLVEATYGLDGATAARMRAEQGWLDRHERFVAQVVAQDVTVRLYDTG
jgi:4-amino-4-deoxy-L-arabinose transferase-like glycosyltransferase